MKLASIFFPASASIFAFEAKILKTSEKYEASWTSQVLRQVFNIFPSECKYLRFCSKDTKNVRTHTRYLPFCEG